MSKECGCKILGGITGMCEEHYQDFRRQAIERRGQYGTAMERMKAECAQLRAENANLEKQVEVLKVNGDRYRAALEKVIWQWTERYDEGGHYSYHRKETLRIAREPLMDTIISNNPVNGQDGDR